jgi:hypothetical protein
MRDGSVLALRQASRTLETDPAQHVGVNKQVAGVDTTMRRSTSRPQSSSRNSGHSVGTTRTVAPEMTLSGPSVKPGSAM